MSGLGKFLKRAAHSIQEKVSGSGIHTVDDEFRSKKKLFEQHKAQFQSLVRRIETYYKAQKKDADNLTQMFDGCTTLMVGGGDQFSLISGVASQARGEMEGGYMIIKQQVAAYNEVIKFISKRIDLRDGYRVDLDMKRTKLDRAGDDPVARATASAALQVYTQTNAQVHANIDMFMSRAPEFIASLTSLILSHQRALLTAGTSLPPVKVIPCPDMSLSDYDVATPVVKNEPEPRPPVTQKAQPRGKTGRALPAPPPKKTGGMVIGLYEYEAEPGDGGLSFSVDERLTVTEKSEDGEWWYAYNSRGDEGYIPCDFVDML